MSDPYELLTVKQVAAELRVTVATVRRYYRTGRLVTGRIGANRMTKRSDLWAFIDGHIKQPSTTP